MKVAQLIVQCGKLIQKQMTFDFSRTFMIRGRVHKGSEKVDMVLEMKEKSHKPRGAGNGPLSYNWEKPNTMLSEVRLQQEAQAL